MRSFGKASAIHSPKSIDEATQVGIGGIDQWIQIRGQNRNHPVLPCLHGGLASNVVAIDGALWPVGEGIHRRAMGPAGCGQDAPGDWFFCGGHKVDRPHGPGTESRSPRTICAGTKFSSWVTLGALSSESKRSHSVPACSMLLSARGGWPTCPKACNFSMSTAGNRSATKKLESGPPPYPRLERFQNHFKWLRRCEAGSDRQAETLELVIFGAQRFTLRDGSCRSLRV